MKITNHNLLMTAVMGGLLCSCNGQQTKYPTAPSDDTTDEYFGITVADPYRPLENDTAAATLKWVEEENAVTNAYLDKIPFRSALRERLTELNNYKKTGLPRKRKMVNITILKTTACRTSQCSTAPTRSEAHPRCSSILTNCPMTVR